MGIAYNKRTADTIQNKRFVSEQLPSYIV